jgi:hypothetical protein
VTEPPIMEPIPGGYRCAFPDETALEALDVQKDQYGRLFATLAAFHQGQLLHRARMNLLAQGEQRDFHKGAASLNGHVNWRARVLALLEGLMQAERQQAEAEDHQHRLRPPEAAAEPFPVEVFPSPLAQLILEGAEALPCPPDFIGVPMLSVLGVAIGTTRLLEIKPNWREGPRIYTAVVADPGSKKSPALDLAVRPLYAQQDHDYRAYQAQRQIYDEQVAQYEIDLAAWKKAVHEGKASLEQRPLAPDEPVMPQIWTSDRTLEALAELLERNPRGVLMVRDELTGWALNMNQYKGGHGADRQAWLSFWSGAPVTINRKSRKQPMILPNPLVCVAGCLPPDVLGDLGDERGREDGFMHRILPSYPAPMAIQWSEATVTDEATKGYTEVVQRLLALNGLDPVTSRVVTFTPRGRAGYVELVSELYARLADPECPPHLRGPWTKLEGYAARLALILQCARLASGETEKEAVEEASVVGAGALVHYFRSHAEKVYARLRCTPEDKQVELALAWIRARGGTATAREILSYKVAGVKTAAGAKELLRRLDDQGYGTVSEGDKRHVVFTLR